MKAYALALCVLLLQACTSAELNAPTPPCASASRDCGPARPLNQSFAQADVLADSVQQ